MKIAIIGSGYVGKAYAKVFPDAIIYDPFIGLSTTKEEVNQADIALICVPTPGTELGGLNMSIVEGVVSWLETPLILIKSALMPGTVDKLVNKYNKKIAVSVELIGEGKYSIPYWKYPHPTDPRLHQVLVIGGEDETAKRCADVIWEKLSPDIDIHFTTAVEAEICKLMENAWGAMKVTFANVMYDICEQYGANYTRVLQAWGADGRTEKMHMRVIPGKRGWGGKCYPKDLGAMANFDDTGLLKKIIEVNNTHRAKNENDSIK